MSRQISLTGILEVYSIWNIHEGHYVSWGDTHMCDSVISAVHGKPA